jgi:putative transposase
VRVALAAVQGDRTISELASQYEVHAGQVTDWKRRLLENVHRVFEEPGEGPRRDAEALQAELYQQIGQLKMELEW